MAQQSPSTILYSQAIAMLDNVKRRYLQGELKTIDDVTQELYRVVSEYETSAGRPMTNFDPIVHGEPPSSRKMNEFWTSLQNDVNIVVDMVNYVKAYAVFVHNFIETEVLQAQRSNQEALNKMKTLQLYSTAQDSSMIILGDNFKDYSFIDNKPFTSLAPRAEIAYPGTLSLPRVGSTSYTEDAKVTVLPTSNGFVGNNQAVNLETVRVDNISGLKTFEFEAQTIHTTDTTNLIDSNPKTWFEYEHNFVYPGDRLAAKNFNFTYRVKDADGVESTVDWAIGPPNGVLKLDLEFQFKKAVTINHLTLKPFGLKDNTNNPIRITNVQVSADGTNWVALSPSNIWIASEANLQVAKIGDSVVTGVASWAFDAQPVRYARLSVEQPNPIDAKVGHIYYDKSVQLTRPPGSDPISQWQLDATPATPNDFESAPPFEEWTEIDNDTASMTVTRNAAHAHFGTYAMKLVNTEAKQDDYMYRRYTRHAWDTYRLEKNKNYVFSAWVYVDSYQNHAKYKRGIMVVARKPWKTLGKTKIWDEHAVGEWVYHEIAFTTPNDFGSIEFRLYSPKGTVYWDDVRIQPAAPRVNTPSQTTYQRAEGPIPSLNNVTQQYTSRQSVVGGLVQRREMFDGKRWAIAIQDVGLEAFTYQARGVVISREFKVNSLIDRVAIEADVEVPESYPASVQWVRFYISPDDGVNWIPISPIQDDYNGVPEVVAFNDPLPAEFREPGVYYFNSSKAVDRLRVKIEITRPGTIDTTSPMVHWYKLKIRKR